MSRRVVVTGASAITPIGNTHAQILEALTLGRSGIKPLRRDAPLANVLNSQVYGEVTGPVRVAVDRHQEKTMAPVSHYGCYVAKEAIEQSGLTDSFVRSGRMGVSFGSTQGSTSASREVFAVLFSPDDPSLARLNPTAYLQLMTHTATVNIARMFGITGRTIASCTACTTGTQSIGFGFEAIRYGLQEAMLLRLRGRVRHDRRCRI